MKSSSDSSILISSLLKTMNATQTSNNCEVLVIKLNKQFWWFQYVSIFEKYIRMGPNWKYGIPSEIEPPLNFNCSWNFTISWNYQSRVLSICAGTNKARQRRSRSNLSIVSDVCHATDFIFSSFFQLTIACFGALIHNDFYRFIIT